MGPFSIRFYAMLLCLVALFSSSFSIEAGSPSTPLEQLPVSDKLALKLYPPLPSKLPNTVNIHLDGKGQGALVEVRGGYRIFDPHTGKRLGTRFSGKSFRLSYHPDGIQWGEIFPGIYQIAIIPDKSGAILIDGIQYPGAVLGFLVGDKLQISNLVDIEEYTAALISHHALRESAVESYPQELLHAMAIAIRSTIFYQVLYNRNAYWHVNDKEVGYRGCSIIHPNSSYNKAVQETRHLVLVTRPYSKDNQPVPFPVVWHSNCGGQTVSYQSFFRQDLPTVPHYSISSEFAQRMRSSTQWHVFIPVSEIERVVGISSITQAVPYIDAQSKKPYALRFESSNGSHKDITTLQLLQALPQIKSSDFSIQIEGDKAHVEGFGRGHGVGICLDTSIALIAQNRNGAELLEYFFPGSHLLSINHPQ